MANSQESNSKMAQFFSYDKENACKNSRHMKKQK
jgi:hypothetical protein